MDWEGLLAAESEEIEQDEQLLESLFSFLLRHDLPRDSELIRDADSVAKIFAVTRAVLKVKGTEAQTYLEELKHAHLPPSSASGEPRGSERDLLDQIVHLEKEVRSRDALIGDLRERHAASPGNEARFLREENEDLKQEIGEVRRMLARERSENERLTSDASAERLKSRQLEREVDQLRQNLEDYRHQLDWQSREGGRASSLRRSGESDFRERLRKKDLEIAEQLDKIEELLNARDSLEGQLHELTVQLGHVEEQRIGALRDMENMRVALVEADSHAENLERRNHLLEGELGDLQQRIKEQSQTDDRIMALVNAKTKEWQSLLSSKQSELEECQGRLSQLEEQLRAAQTGADRVTIVRMKQQLQLRDAQLSSLQGELSEAAGNLETLTSQLHHTRQKADPLLVNPQLHQEVEQLRSKVQSLEEEMMLEVRRREESELQKEEKDVELSQALGRLGEYERGEYGLHEAVQEIKMKKEEIAIRDRDIAELTQKMNILESELGQLCEENEALRDHVGVREGEEVDLAPLRSKQGAELGRLREANRRLEREVEHLEEEKLNMRKQLLEQAMNRSQRNVEHGPTSELLSEEPGLEGGTGEGGGGRQRQRTATEQNRKIHQLTVQLSELQEACNSEKHRGELCRQEVSRLTVQLREKGELVEQYEEALRELAGRRRGGEAGEEAEETKKNALERLVAMLEARSTDGRYDITPQLKTEVSELSGQAAELRQQVQRLEKELREALKMTERKQFEVESLQKEVQQLKKASTGFQPLCLPDGLPMTSSDIIGSLNEHLLHVLKELRSREQALAETQEALERYRRKFAVIIHQQGVVYKEYREGFERWEGEKEKLVEGKREMATLREQDQIRIQELTNLHKTLAADPDDQRRRIGELSRKVTILRVNEKTLSRRYSLLLEAEDTLRKENGQLRGDLVAMEKAITERLGYLERYKEAVQFKLSALQHQLSESVPTSLLERANSQYSELVSRHQEMLQLHANHTSTTNTIDHLQKEVKMLSGQLESVKQELTLEKQKCRLLEQNTSSATESKALGRRGDGEGDAGRVLAERLATLEMRELNERQRADLSVTRYQQVREALSHLEERNGELERRFSELSQKLLQSQAREAELSDSLTGCLTQADRESLEARLQALQTSEMRLKLENTQLKEVAEVARQQSVAMEMWQKSRDLEMSSLRHQLLDLQMQSDDKTATGKLHHQIVTLQVSEATALKKLEEANGKVLRLEASLLRCEQQRDEMSSAVFHVRAESQGKIRHLRETIQSLRRQYAGALPLCEQERHVELVRKVEEERREAERAREDARREQEQVEEKLLQLELQHSNLQELMASLRDSKSTAAKLTEWHAKLGEMRLQEMKLTRALERERGRVKHLEGLVGTSEKAFAKLEQDLVHMTKDYEAAQLGWEQRELELEQQLEQLKQQQGRMASAADRLERAAGNIPDPHLPVASQLEQAVKSLRENAQVISDLKRRTKKAEEQADKMERALNRAQNELLQRDREIAELRLEISHGSSESPESHVERDERGEVSQRMLKVAQETIQQLKALVDQKESLADKYQRLLQAARQELQTATESHRSEVASLMQQLHSKTDSAFSKLREAALDAVNVSKPELPTDKQLARLQELEELVVEQENANATLSQEVKRIHQEMVEAGQAAEVRLAKLREEMEEMRRAHQLEIKELRGVVEERSSRATELEQEVEVLEGELSAAQEAAKQAPSRTMRSLVERLRNQLAIKEKQHKALSEALLQVRADLVETTQKTLEGHARQEIHDANIQQLVDKRTSELQARIHTLSGLVDQLRQQLEETRAGEEEAREAMRRVEQERGVVVQQLQGEMEQLQKTLEQAKTREQKLVQEAQELHHQLGQNGDVGELQRRVRDLQDKLHKQKQQTRECEEALRHGGGAARKPGEMQSVVEASSQIDSKHHSAEVLKWEESKRWQKKVEGLKSKISEKNKELEAAQKQINSLKEMLSRADREKGILQGKLRCAQRTINEGTHTHQHPSSTEAAAATKEGKAAAAVEQQHKLKTRIFELENEVQHLERELKVERASECHELQLRNNQLLKTVEALERQLQQQHPGSSGQLHALREHEQRLQDDVLQCQKENMHLRFEYEQARVELPRLKMRIEDQQHYIEVLNESTQSEGNIRTAAKKDSAVGGHSVAEMERVVAAMRKVVEKLQSENESLRRSAKQRGTSVTQLETENRRLKSEMERLRSTIPSSEGEPLTSKSPYAKIVAENERLRKDLKKEIDKNERLQLSLSTFEVQNSKLQQELHEMSSHPHPYSRGEGHSGYEERVEILQAEVEKKNRMLLEVKRHLREAAEREQQLKTISNDSQLSERYLATLQERDALQQQVTQLKKELDAFDPAFFEEIEDLKYNYQEAVKKNIQYEEQLVALAKQFGVSVPGLETS